MSKTKSKFKKGLRAELKRINKNNCRLTDIEIFQKSLTSYENEIYKLLWQDAKAQEFKAFDDPRQTTNQIFFTVEHYVDIKEMEKWIKNKLDNEEGFDFDYVTRTFIKFDETNKEFIKFKKRLKLQQNLVKRGFINNITFPFFKVIPISQTKNKFNEEYLVNDNTLSWKNQKFNNLLDDEKKRKDFVKKYWGKSQYINEKIIELFLRGNQILEISYVEFEVDITEKGLELLHNNWWQRNWKWLVTLLSSILIPILIKLIWK